MSRKIKILTLGEVEHIAHVLAQELMEWDEPIPPFSTRYPNKLESCLLVPFQQFGGQRLYKTFTERAAVLFYLLIKNHPFQNGNKRMAVTTLLVFLAKNGKWLKISNQELYNFALWVASSPPAVKDSTVQAIDSFVRKYMVQLTH